LLLTPAFTSNCSKDVNVIEEGLTDAEDFLIKVAVFNEGQDRTFEGSNEGWEVKVGSLGVTLS
jgi:hypothetical protein